jgi:hypothetical protein
MNTLGNNTNTGQRERFADIDLKRIKQRSIHYWFEDGLGEIVIGALFLMIGLSAFIEGLAAPGTTTRRVSGITGLLIMVSGPWLARPVLAKLKERITYPRTGYVSYRKTKVTRSRRIMSYILTLLIVGIVVGIISASPEKTLAWIPLIEGLAIGGFLLYLGHRTDLLRFYSLGVYAILLGAGLSVAGFGNLTGMGIFFIITGTTLLLSGGLSLKTYLRLTQPQTEHFDE